jgi:hypothetical protein
MFAFDGALQVTRPHMLIRSFGKQKFPAAGVRRNRNCPRSFENALLHLAHSISRTLPIDRDATDGTLPFVQPVRELR